MSEKHTLPESPRIPRRLALVTLLAGAGVIVLPSCGGGGGGDTAGVDTGGTGAFSSGAISGFGSVIVNGVRYEDNTARIGHDDDDVTLRADDLKLGMVVRVQAGPITPGSGDTLPSATATSIIVESQIKGPVQSRTGLDGTAPDTLVVFGQTVRVDARTVFEDGLTFAAIGVGNVLEVSGFVDAAGVVTATRIERENNANEFKVRGVIANFDATQRTFTIGTAKFIIPTAARLPATPLQDGLFVRVRTQTVADASGNWVVNRIDLRQGLDDRDEAEVEGILVNTAGVLSVNGITLDVSRLAAGAAAAFVGQRVEVEGQLRNGTLIVREIKLDDDAGEVDVRGTVSDLDTAGQTFSVRGVTFHYSTQTRQDDGTIATNLNNGVNVRVRGVVSAIAGAPIEATRIDFRP